MTGHVDANRESSDDLLTEIRAILDDAPELLETLPPVEQAVAEAVIEDQSGQGE